MKPTKNLYLNSRQTRRFVGYVSCLCDWRELMLDFFFLLFSLSICLLAELCMKFNKFSRNLFVQTCSWRWVNLTKILIKGFSQTLTARRRSSTQGFFFFSLFSSSSYFHIGRNWASGSEGVRPNLSEECILLWLIHSETPDLTDRNTSEKRGSTTWRLKRGIWAFTKYFEIKRGFFVLFCF